MNIYNQLFKFLLITLVANVYADQGGYDPNAATGGGYDIEAVNRAEAAAAKKQADEIKRQRNLSIKKQLQDKIKKTEALKAKRENEVTPDKIVQFTNDQVCEKLEESLHKKAMDHVDVAWKNEAIKRKIINSDNIQLIGDRKISIGMSNCEVVASWGKPDNMTNTVTAKNIISSYIYDKKYIQLIDGKVTAITY